MNCRVKRRPRSWFYIFLLSVGAIWGESPPPAPAAVERPLAHASLSPALRAAAERDGIDLTRKEAGEGAVAQGDTVVAWVGATRGTRFQQWLIQFKRSSASAAEQKKHRPKVITKYLSWGPVITFKSEVEALDLWIAGPVEAGAQNALNVTAPVAVRRARVFVPGEYLRLGLEQSERAHRHFVRRVTEIRKEDPKFTGGNIYTLDKPIEPQNIKWAKTDAEKIGFTPEIERAWVGGYVGLQAFYEIVNDQPALREIAEIAVEKPSALKLAKLAFGAQFMTIFGGPDSRPLDPASVGLLPVGLESFEVPYFFALAQDRIVSGWMVVTTPNPPLDVTAGILALTAVHPKDPTRVVEVQLISAARAAVKPLPNK